MFEAQSVFSSFSVDNLHEATLFYNDVMGLEIINEEMGISFALPSGGTAFVYQKDGHQPATFTILNFVVEDIDQAVDMMLARGVVFERYEGLPVAQDDKGILRGLAAGQGPDIAWLRDPAGNVVSIIQSA